MNHTEGHISKPIRHEIRKSTPLLTAEELIPLFSDSTLYSKKSFFFIEGDHKDRHACRHVPTHIQEAQLVRQKFLEGCTIIVKNLDHYNEKIRAKCDELGTDVDVHLYLVGRDNARSFQLHKDDTDVWIHMLYGVKHFFMSPDGKSESESQCTLNEGEELFLPQTEWHRAESEGPSALLSFGIKEAVKYHVPGGIEFSDIHL